MPHKTLCVVWHEKGRRIEFVLTRNSQVGGGVSQLLRLKCVNARSCACLAHQKMNSQKLITQTLFFIYLLLSRDHGTF